MKQISLMPAGAPRGVARLIRAAGWRTQPAVGEAAEQPMGALDLARGGRPAVFVPQDAWVGRALRRIVVVHGGTPAEHDAIDAANRAALVAGATVVILHVPSARASRDLASLPMRFEDHPAHDRAEWLEEYRRRFCRPSRGVEMSVHFANGPLADAARNEARHFRANLLIASALGADQPSVAAFIAMVRASPCPVLIVPGTPYRHRRTSHAAYASPPIRVPSDRA